MAEIITIVEPEGGADGEYSMFIGRYSPPHEGHYKLMQAILDEGGKVFIAIRDTSMSEKNPYSLEERVNIFEEHFEQEWLVGRVRIGLIPDVKEVCYGRKVGWAVKQIKLDEATEAISATKIREGKV